jgi:hypothetical protein
LEFALFRTFCVLRISALLDRAGEFQTRSQKRYDDTDIIVSELMEWRYDSDRRKRALGRMNQLHGRFAIANDDFLYVLSTFIYEPIRLNARFGWRLMCEQEREVGDRMKDYESFERFNRDYERQHYHFTEAEQRVGAATRERFISWFPSLLAPIVRSTIYARLDDALSDGFGFPHPSFDMRRLAPAALRLRGVVAGLLPPRRQPRLRTEMRHPAYPDG